MKRLGGISALIGARRCCCRKLCCSGKERQQEQLEDYDKKPRKGVTVINAPEIRKLPLVSKPHHTAYKRIVLRALPVRFSHNKAKPHLHNPIIKCIPIYFLLLLASQNKLLVLFQHDSLLVQTCYLQACIYLAKT